jgi:hypothetical protein
VTVGSLRSLARLAVLRPALVNGAAGIILPENGEPQAVWGITVARGKIVEIDIVANPERLRQLGVGPTRGQWPRIALPPC